MSIILVLVLILGACATHQRFTVPEVEVGQPAFNRIVEGHTFSSLVGGNDVQLLLNGEQIFPAMLETIRGARHTITFANYLYETGAIADEMAEAFAERCRTGVKVHILLDASGSNKMPKHLRETMREAGCRGKEFTVIDFEGESRRSLGERRLKRSPLHDVASMLRSFDYAARRALSDRLDGRAAGRARNRSIEQRWARFWRDWVCAAFLREYVGIATREQLVPADPDVFIPLLDVYLLERAIYELGYELEERPEWTGIPLLAILELLRARSDRDHPDGRSRRPRRARARTA